MTYCELNHSGCSSDINKKMSDKRVAIVTGAYGAIGKSIARLLAEKDHEVVLIGRNESRLHSVVEEIIEMTGNQSVRYYPVDLSRESDIKALARNWKGPLHVMVNNAGTTPRQWTETPEGIEMQFATNVLGYFWMMKHLLPFMKDVDDARIVNVASYWAGGLDFNDLEFRRRSYHNDTAYRQSKQADRMLTVAFAEKYREYGITVNAAHPGDVNSKLSNNLGYGGHEYPDQGAGTPVWLATSPEVKGVTGKYFEHRRDVGCSFSRDKDGIQKLMEVCESF